MMNVIKIITAICSLLFFMIGADKFFSFLEPPCSLMHHLPWIVVKIFGVLQIAASILIWVPKLKEYVVGFFLVFMLVFSSIHLIESTYDIGGSAFMAFLLAILVWDPSFLRGEKD